MGIKASWAGSVLAQMYLVESVFVTERAARAARSVLTRSAHRRERAGVVTTESQQLLCLKVLASMTAHVLPLVAPPTKTPPVHAANRWSLLSPVQITDAPKSGTGWEPVSMFPMLTGQKWMQAST